MSKKKTPKAKKTSGHLDWNPVSYDAAKRFVDLANGTDPRGSQTASAMRQAIAIFGALTCPSPVEDRSGEYRVALSAEGLIQIQRRCDTGWESVA